MITCLSLCPVALLNFPLAILTLIFIVPLLSLASPLFSPMFPLPPSSPLASSASFRLPLFVRLLYLPRKLIQVFSLLFFCPPVIVVVLTAIQAMDVHSFVLSCLSLVASSSNLLFPIFFFTYVPVYLISFFIALTPVRAT
jgi:hypothetical protein